MSNSYSLGQLGWSTYFSQQLEPGELASAYPARVFAVHRNCIEIRSVRGDEVVLQNRCRLIQSDTLVAVGDWVLVQEDARHLSRIIRRRTIISRRAAGADGSAQSIAANVDVLFVVSSCDNDFNLSRLERYLWLARHSNVRSVIV